MFGVWSFGRSVFGTIEFRVPCPCSEHLGPLGRASGHLPLPSNTFGLLRISILSSCATGRFFPDSGLRTPDSDGSFPTPDPDSGLRTVLSQRRTPNSERVTPPSSLHTAGLRRRGPPARRQHVDLWFVLRHQLRFHSRHLDGIHLEDVPQLKMVGKTRRSEFGVRCSVSRDPGHGIRDSRLGTRVPRPGLLRIQEFRIPDSRRRTPDPGRRTRLFRLQTPDSGLRTPDLLFRFRLRTPDSGLRTWISGSELPNSQLRTLLPRPTLPAATVFGQAALPAL